MILSKYKLHGWQLILCSINTFDIGVITVGAVFIFLLSSYEFHLLCSNPILNFCLEKIGGSSPTFISYCVLINYVSTKKYNLINTHLVTKTRDRVSVQIVLI